MQVVVVIKVIVMVKIVSNAYHVVGILLQSFLVVDVMVVEFIR